MARKYEGVDSEEHKFSPRRNGRSCCIRPHWRGFDDHGSHPIITLRRCSGHPLRAGTNVPSRNELCVSNGCGVHASAPKVQQCREVIQMAFLKDGESLENSLPWRCLTPKRDRNGTHLMSKRVCMYLLTYPEYDRKWRRVDVPHERFLLL